MSATTVVLDDDLIQRVNKESRSRGVSFDATLNALLRAALPGKPKSRRRPFKIRPMSMGYRPELNYDKIATLIAYGDCPFHR